jgi:hypothetical protein
VQFPWRLLSISTFTLAFLSGAALHALPDGTRDLVPTLAVVFLFVLGSYTYSVPQHTEAVFNYQAQMEFEVKDRELLGDTIWMAPGERPQDSPLVEQYRSGQKLQRAVTLDNNATVETVRYGGQSVDANVQASAPARILFYTRYFPGWTGTIDDKTADVEPYGEQGLIAVAVPPGSHIVRLRFEDTFARKFGAIISGASLLAALGLLKFRTDASKEK